MHALSIAAPAKINLLLQVGPRDAHGYHPLASWFCTVALFDSLSIARDDSAGIRFECDDPALPRDSRNLVVAAAERLLAGRSRAPGLSLALTKRIPSAAGLGGGSSDAAATLAGINRLLALGVSRKELTTLGASLGSDVPFFFAQPSAWCTGRGEITTPMPAPRAARWALLVFPPMGLSTAAVYRRFDEMSLGSDISPSLPSTAQDLPNLRSIELLPLLRNDLEPPAFNLAPDLAECREAIERFLGRPVRMSGSGSTLFTLFDEATEAASASRKALDRFGSLRFAAIELSPEPDDAYNMSGIV